MRREAEEREESPDDVKWRKISSWAIFGAWFFVVFWAFLDISNDIRGFSFASYHPDSTKSLARLAVAPYARIILLSVAVFATFFKVLLTLPRLATGLALSPALLGVAFHFYLETIPQGPSAHIMYAGNVAFNVPWRFTPEGYKEPGSESKFSITDSFLLYDTYNKDSKKKVRLRIIASNESLFNNIKNPTIHDNDRLIDCFHKECVHQIISSGIFLSIKYEIRNFDKHMLIEKQILDLFNTFRSNAN